jgi:hypothetical protein
MMYQTTMTLSGTPRIQATMYRMSTSPQVDPAKGAPALVVAKDLNRRPDQLCRL